jgi:hypothetical protein
MFKKGQPNSKLYQETMDRKKLELENHYQEIFEKYHDILSNTSKTIGQRVKEVKRAEGKLNTNKVTKYISDNGWKKITKPYSANKSDLTLEGNNDRGKKRHSLPKIWKKLSLSNHYLVYNGYNWKCGLIIYNDSYAMLAATATHSSIGKDVKSTHIGQSDYNGEYENEYLIINRDREVVYHTMHKKRHITLLSAKEAFFKLSIQANQNYFHCFADKQAKKVKVKGKSGNRCFKNFYPKYIIKISP